MKQGSSRTKETGATYLQKKQPGYRRFSRGAVDQCLQANHYTDPKAGQTCSQLRRCLNPVEKARRGFWHTDQRRFG